MMLFIDGTWLYSNTPRLAESYGKEDFQVDFGLLPQVLAEEVKKQLGAAEVDVVRTYLFGSYASNYDLRDDDVVQRRLDFFSMLKEEYRYELEIFPINFRGRRVRKVDRDPKDTFEPREKCVDISLATSMLYFAVIPHAYDIAIAVVGDQDFKPVFQHVRRLGKRVAIASIQGSCAPEFASPRDEAKVKDFRLIWLDDLLPKLELKYERHQLECQSPAHKGDRRVWTTYHPRRGRKFFCDECRAEFANQKQEAQQEFVNSQVEALFPSDMGGSAGLGQLLSGMVKKKVAERGFGFIHADDGRDYFFHLTDLQAGLEFDEVGEGLPVDFEVKKEPSYDKAGAAQNVRRHEV
jgi:cold shock CspA family protein